MHRKLLLALFAGLLSAIPALAQGLEKSKDWPQWRGPARDGICTETNLLSAWPKEGPPLLWNSKVVNGGKNIGFGYSSLAIVGGKVFTMGGHGGKDDMECFAYCLDEKTGKQLWETAIGPDKAGGYPGPRCVPTVDGNRVYVLSRLGVLMCLDTEKGHVIWKKDYPKDFNGKMMSGWGFSESPLIDGDKLVCTPGGNDAALVALNKMTGDVIWKCAIDKVGGAAYSSIVVAEVGGIRQYITLMHPSKGLVGVDASNGKFLWNYKKAANGTANIPTAVVKGDLVFTSTGYGAGAAVLQLVPEGSGITANEVWFQTGKTLQNHHGGVVLIGDYIFGGHGHNQGWPFCVEMKTGKFAWEPVRGAGDGSACVLYADGHLYFRYQNNVMALVEATPEAYKLKSQFKLPTTSGALGIGWTHPVIHNGKLFIRCDDQLLCYEISKK